MPNPKEDGMISDSEGSSFSLKSIPFLGRIILLLRASQRTAWGIGVLVIDFAVFSKTWILPPESTESATFFLVNAVVLSFLFGERFILSIMPIVQPLLTNLYGIKYGTQSSSSSTTVIEEKKSS